MRFLVVFCHPSEESFSAALNNLVCKTLQKSNHQIRLLDLYRIDFNPVLSKNEWDVYLDDTQQIIKNVQQHVDDLQWAEGLIFIFPTWMYGPPALLKGWLERVWLPDIAFEIPSAKNRRAIGKLTNIKKFFVITTSGSPRWWLWLIGNPAKSMLFKGYKVLFSRKCTLKWLQLYDMNHSTNFDRKKFLKKVEDFLSNIY